MQICSGGVPAARGRWDAHENCRDNHAVEARKIDQPVAALWRDLKQRGMLDDTLVLFGSEFGRTPFTQSAANIVGTGRDHNRYGFSLWMAGAGLKPGVAFGATDEVGWRSVEHPVPWHDFHATVLHLLGIDHERLTFYHNGIQRGSRTCRRSDRRGFWAVGKQAGFQPRQRRQPPRNRAKRILVFLESERPLGSKNRQSPGLTPSRLIAMVLVRSRRETRRVHADCSCFLLGAPAHRRRCRMATPQICHNERG